MFGFGWVRIHLRVVFGDSFGVFEVFGCVFRKIDKMIKKLWAKSGVLCHGIVIPCHSEGPRQGVACPHWGGAERRIWPASGSPQHRNTTPQRSSATPRRSTVHSMANFDALFRFAIPLFRGLVYWTNEDPVSV